MKDGLDSLARAIREEVLLAGRLAALIVEKKAAVIANDLAQIDRLTREEHEATDQLEELAFARQDLVLRISREADGLRHTENLGDLVRQLPAAQATALAALRQDLLAAYDRIKDGTRLNGELLDQSMRVTRHLFDRMSSIDNRIRKGRANYGPPGRAGKAAARPAATGKH